MNLTMTDFSFPLKLYRESLGVAEVAKILSYYLHIYLSLINYMTEFSDENDEKHIS